MIIPDHYIFTADAKAGAMWDPARVCGGSGNPPTSTTWARSGIRASATLVFRGRAHPSPRGAFRHRLAPARMALSVSLHTGIGNTGAGFILGVGKLWVRVPETMRFIFDGSMPPI